MHSKTGMLSYRRQRTGSQHEVLEFVITTQRSSIEGFLTEERDLAPVGVEAAAVVVWRKREREREPQGGQGRWYRSELIPLQVGFCGSFVIVRWFCVSPRQCDHWS